jgi:hypothetical protein
MWDLLWANLRHLPDPLSRAVWRELYSRAFSANWYALEGQVEAEALRVAREGPDNTLAFLHFPLPHAPFVFEADGRYAGPFEGADVRDAGEQRSVRGYVVGSSSTRWRRRVARLALVIVTSAARRPHALGVMGRATYAELGSTGLGPAAVRAAPSLYKRVRSRAYDALPPFSLARRPCMALVDRVKRMLLTPDEEWQVIDAEPTTAAELYKGYIMPLAAIGPLAATLGWLIFGYRGSLASGLGPVLTWAAVSFLMTLGGVYVLALIIDALAPNFDATRDQLQALKVAAYASTASWLAGIFGLVPALRWLGLLGLYSLYLLYLGLPRLMRAPEDKALGYTVLVIFAAIILFLVIGLVAATFLGR